MTKKELVAEILKIKAVDSKSNLMTKKNEELEEILSSLQGENTVTEEPQKKEEPVVPKKKVIDRDTVVSCRNITSGKLTYISKKSGLEIVWSNFGDEEYIDVAELLTMKSSQPKFLKEPWLFIDDAEVAEYLGLKELYKSLIPIDEVEDFFNLDIKKAKEILPRLPKGMRSLIGEKARQGIQDESLTNIQLIKLLEQELDIDLISLMY